MIVLKNVATLSQTLSSCGLKARSFFIILVLAFVNFSDCVLNYILQGSWKINEGLALPKSLKMGNLCSKNAPSNGQDEVCFLIQCSQKFRCRDSIIINDSGSFH